MKLVREVLAEMPRTKIVHQRGQEYLHVECTSAILRFIDDLEIYLDSTTNEIQLRSASRIGHSDLGVNRRRVEEFQGRYRQRLPANR